MSQQPFTDLDPEEHHKPPYIVAVRDLEDDSFCPLASVEKRDGVIRYQICHNTVDLASCACCGLPTCRYHEDQAQDVDNLAICVLCGKLSPDTRRAVRAFRLRLEMGNI